MQDIPDELDLYFFPPYEPVSIYEAVMPVLLVGFPVIYKSILKLATWLLLNKSFAIP